jgi:catechol 2,3-dioxygenase-like lactoylglutathione lyase family enzyme
LEINGVAHIILRVSRFEECVAFYDALMPRLGLAAVFRTDEFVYYVVGRTAFGSGGRHRSSLGTLMRSWRPGSITSVSALAPVRTSTRSTRSCGRSGVRAPEDGPWAPGYYSLSFRDPEGIRLEVNHVPGKGLLADRQH